MTPDKVPQGTNYSFTFKLDAEDLSGFSYQLDVKQYPGDTAAISRAVTANSDYEVKVTLTPAETLALGVGLWWIIITSTDSDEEIEETKRIQITKGWA